MKLSSKLRSYWREFHFVAKALRSSQHPVLAHIIPMRRCNLACTYCNEYDHTSQPVPLDIVKHRLDKLAGLGTTAVIVSGGEPLLHPGIIEIIAHIRNHGMLTAMISNCYLLTREKIGALNRAGLEYLQVSIDNVNPDQISKKSLKLLDQKLVWLSQLAEFKVNINSVIGACGKPEDALIIGRRAEELGFSASLGIIHDSSGRLKPLDDIEREVYLKMRRIGKKGYVRINYFQQNLVDGKANDWRCRAGARYLYVCEDGLVHYCSQQRGYPGIPLENYTKADIRREYFSRKECADFCTVGCVHQVALLDRWRDPQLIPSGRPQPQPASTANGDALYQIDLKRA